MPKFNKPIIVKLTNTEIAEYLRKVSQSVYNLRKIIDAHLTKPIEEDKDLNFFYVDELDTLHKLLKTPVGLTIISFDYIDRRLSRNLMFNRGKTKNAIKELDDADDCIRTVLGKIQNMRRKYYGTSTPTQGLEEGPLKVFLDQKLIIKKGVEITEEIKKISTQVEQEIFIGPLKYKDFSISYKEKPLDLAPQLVKLCKLFIEKSWKTDSFVPDDAIREVITVKNYISLGNIQKLVSKLRRILKKENSHLKIERINSEGYMFIAKNIR